MTYETTLSLHLYGHRLAERNRSVITPLPVYVGPRRSGQSLPPVPSPQVSAESAEPFGLVILAGFNLLRLHFRQELPSAGTTLMPGQKNVTAATRPSVQVPGQGRTTPGRNQAGNLPRPTALPPMPFVSGYSHG